jgi:hypothetical protein
MSNKKEDNEHSDQNQDQNSGKSSSKVIPIAYAGPEQMVY